MSKIELLAKIELLNKYEAMLEELNVEADNVRNSKSRDVIVSNNLQISFSFKSQK